MHDMLALISACWQLQGKGRGGGAGFFDQGQPQRKDMPATVCVLVTHLAIHALQVVLALTMLLVCSCRQQQQQQQSLCRFVCCSFTWTGGQGAPLLATTDYTLVGSRIILDGWQIRCRTTVPLCVCIGCFSPVR
jgi:hypothetical protein